MPEGETPTAGQVSAGSESHVPASEGQVPETPSTPSPESSATATTTPTGKPALTLEQALDALEKTRKEAAQQRVDAKRLKELEAAVKARDEADLTELQKTQKRLAELQQSQVEAERKQQERVIRYAVQAHASTAGIPADLASRLIDYSEIEYDEEGEPTNVGKLLDKLVKAYPQLKGNAATTPSAPPQPTSVGATPGNPARSGAHSGAITQEYLNSLTPKQYAEMPDSRRSEILNWIAANAAAIRK